jgi:hypothetical protein
VQEHREFEKLVMMHKIVHENCPVYLLDLIKLRIPLFGAEVFIFCDRLWNTFSDEMCMNSNIDAFK